MFRGYSPSWQGSEAAIYVASEAGSREMNAHDSVFFISLNN